MATFDLGTKIPSFNKDAYFPYLSDKPGIFKTFEFDYAAPGTNEDDSINLLKRGELFYTTANGIKKLQIETTNATIVAPDVEIGFVIGVYSDDWNTFYDEGYQFTASGGKVICFVGKEIEVYTNLITIHSLNGAGADTEVTLDPATHAASAAVLEGLIKVASKDTVNPTFVFK